MSRVSKILLALQSFMTPISSTCNRSAEKAALAKSAKFVEDPPHIVRIRRVYVTPSKILMFPPEPETGNSVLRAFKNAECFIRVTMTDEDDRIQVKPQLTQYIYIYIYELLS